MVKVLYRDEQICVVNKDPGNVVHRTRGAQNSPVILQALRDQIGQRVFPVHRLDRGTSGCLAFALSSERAQKLQLNLQEGQKKYLALCLGHFPQDGIFDRPLTNQNKQKQEAITKYRVLKKFDLYSLLELNLVTGRRHQIRRHLSFEGHHIIGDVQHGKGWLNQRFRDDYDFHRLFLHCHFLSFLHPETGERLNIHCDLDESLQDLLDKLTK